MSQKLTGTGNLYTVDVPNMENTYVVEMLVWHPVSKVPHNDKDWYDRRSAQLAEAYKTELQQKYPNETFRINYKTWTSGVEAMKEYIAEQVREEDISTVKEK